MTRQRVLRLALVGCGNIARAHWHGIRHHVPELQVVAAVDANPQRAAAMAERTQSRPFSSLSEALASIDIDAVDIMLPHDLHEAVALEAFAAGKHVVLEKPMAQDLAACERILAAARKAGSVFMIAEQSQYWPDVHRAKALLDAGAIGNLVSARAYFVDNLRRDPADPVPWRFRLARAGGGISMDGGLHWIRPLRILLGDVDAVVAVTGRPVADMEGESYAQAILRFRGGATAHFECLLTESPVGPVQDFRLTGTRGELVIERGAEGRLMCFDAAAPTGREVARTSPGRLDSFGFELADFVAAVLDGKPLAASPEYSLGDLRTALAMYRSAASGRWESVWD